MKENLPKYNPKTKKFEKIQQNDSTSDSKKNTLSSNSDNENIESQIQSKQQSENTEIKNENKTPSNPKKYQFMIKKQIFHYIQYMKFSVKNFLILFVEYVYLL